MSHQTTEVKINIFDMLIAFQKVAWMPSAMTVQRGKSEGVLFSNSLCVLALKW